jgi:hypothetical protein
MKYKTVAMLLILGAQPSYGAPSCHHYSKWYYHYPQKCFTAFVPRLKFKQVIKPASLESPLPPTKYHDVPVLPTPLMIVCVKRDDERAYGLCLLKAALDELFSDKDK